MLVLQKAHSGFYEAGHPLVRVGDQEDGFRMDGTEARGIRAVEERPDQCADTRVSSRRRTVVWERPALLGGHLAESREAKVLWRQWERLYLVGGVLHRRFHELEGQGWRPQLVVPADRRSIILQRLHGGAIGAHLGTARTLALAEQGFYWPGMRVEVSRICNEWDCAMLKKRRGQREPLHQYIVGVPMERLAMDVTGPYPITSTGNQYCLMDGCYFSK